MALPKRWEPYSAVGERIEGTRFISFKVPLNDKLSKRLPEELRFTPDNLVEILKERGQTLAGVIDLTNTFRYYNKQEILKNNIQHVKILVEGKRIPSSKIVNSFYSTVEKILKETDNEESLIGVHCTHGVNRTGYLICRYMVERMSMDPDKAIEAFSAARGHPIERENFLEDLRLRRDGGEGLPESSANNAEHKVGDYRREFSFREQAFRGRSGQPPGWGRPNRHKEEYKYRGHSRESYRDRERFLDHEQFPARERGFHPRSNQGNFSGDYGRSERGNWRDNRGSYRGAYSYSFAGHRQRSPYERPHNQSSRYRHYPQDQSFQNYNQRQSHYGHYGQFGEYSGDNSGYFS